MYPHHYNRLRVTWVKSLRRDELQACLGKFDLDISRDEKAMGPIHQSGPQARPRQTTAMTASNNGIAVTTKSPTTSKCTNTTSTAEVALAKTVTEATAAINSA
ncbi:hypothetical protein GQX74_000168 [Glossina fuscipes]|nr:hypothetical protein GQX74_000168 [Glossina fuscipes]